MTAPEELDFSRAAPRLSRFMTIIAALGTVVAFAFGGWRSGAGFLLGATLSILNFRWLKSLVAGLGGKARPGAVFFAFRYLLLGGVGYVILLYSPLNVTALLVGLFVLIAA